MYGWGEDVLQKIRLALETACADPVGEFVSRLGLF